MPQLRIDPVCGRRVYVAEERAGRPNDYAVASAPPPPPAAPSHEACPFCAGHEAATPHESAVTLDARGNWRVRVVPNKYPAVSPTASAVVETAGVRMHDSTAAFGAHEVIIETPDHVTELAELGADQLAVVLAMYRDRLRHWSTDGRLRHATVFKNSGFAAGASLTHIHSQLVALPYVPPAVQAELEGAARWQAVHGQCVFCEIFERERNGGPRLVLEQSGFVAICPYAARQPFEIWVLPTRHAARFEQLDDAGLGPLAAILQELTRRLATQCRRRGYPLAYNLILHTSPFDDSHAAAYHWHWELIPRTTHLAGLEWGAGVFINPVSPERAAQELRDA
jgi:UDPglucose--hexose-1-phosphate uridylyltransferase